MQWEYMEVGGAGGVLRPFPFGEPESGRLSSQENPGQ